MSTFVDRVVLHVKAGSGGHGCVSIKREKFKPLAGPDGANGGHGGSVILEVDPQTTTLLSYHHAPHQRAENGTPGQGDFRQGRNGEDLILPVPDGTVVTDMEGNVLADLIGAGTRFIAGGGGAGGLGNAALASAKRKAPGFALLGEPGDEISLTLELKSVADVALVGFPSAGKSSLIAAVSAARPKIADYPFTTLVPNLGVVEAGERRYTIADVPGLIPGASAGRGLGLEFLRHIERCGIIVHVLDCATLEPDRDPVSDLEALELELGAYAEAFADAGTVPLMERPRVVVLNKVDVPEAGDLAEMVRPEFEARGYPVFIISAVSHEGLRPLTYALGELVAADRARQAAKPVSERVVIRPQAVDDAGFTVTEKRGPDGEPVFQIRGSKPERWVRQTDFANDEAVGYLSDRLNKLGIEEQLFKKGATPGVTVVIGPLEGGVVFDWEPTMMAGAEHLGSRGTDLRLEEGARPSRTERRRDYTARMDAKAAARGELASEREQGLWTDPADDDS